MDSIHAQKLVDELCGDATLLLALMEELPLVLRWKLEMDE